MSNVDMNLIAAVLDLADAHDDRHLRRIKALCERLSAYMSVTAQQLSTERVTLNEDFLTLMRTVALQARRTEALERTAAAQHQRIHSLEHSLAGQTEQIHALNATVIELLVRVQGLETALAARAPAPGH